MVLNVFLELRLFHEHVWLCVSEEEMFGTDESLHTAAHGVMEQQADKNLMHVLSMGSKALMLQVWMNISTRAFIFR